MIKQYFVLFLVLIALDYSQTARMNDLTCPHVDFNSWHRCKKYDARAQEIECTDDEISALAQLAEKKFTGSGRRFVHTIYFYRNGEPFQRSGNECIAKNALPKHTCRRSATNVWTCTRENPARPVHSTINGHWIRDEL